MSIYFQLPANQIACYCIAYGVLANFILYLTGIQHHKTDSDSGKID